MSVLPGPDFDFDDDPEPDPVDDEGWRFKASRICPACRGTGKPAPRKSTDTYALGSRSMCPTCDGKKRLTESFDIVRLRALLAPPWPRPSR
jgi:DnaJ-class molecular chaperone